MAIVLWGFLEIRYYSTSTLPSNKAPWGALFVGGLFVKIIFRWCVFGDGCLFVDIQWVKIGRETKLVRCDR